METEKMIKELRSIEKKYANEPAETFRVRIADMAKDCANKIEELNNQIKEITKVPEVKIRKCYYHPCAQCINNICTSSEELCPHIMEEEE